MRHVIPVLAILLLPGTAEAQQAPSLDPTRMKYLFSPIETIISINRKGNAGREELVRALQEACGALENLTNDEEFRNLLTHAEERGSGGLSPEADEMYREFNAFLEFLKIERETLLEHLSEGAVDEILGRLLAARLQVQGFQIDADAVMSSLNETTAATCAAGTDVQERVERDELVNFIGRSLLVLEGGAIIAADAPLLVTPLVPYGVASTAGGSY